MLEKLWILIKAKGPKFVAACATHDFLSMALGWQMAYHSWHVYKDWLTAADMAEGEKWVKKFGIEQSPMDTVGILGLGFILH